MTELTSAAARSARVWLVGILIALAYALLYAIIAGTLKASPSLRIHDFTATTGEERGVPEMARYRISPRGGDGN